MLGKLFKYDFKAMGRILLPLFGATAVVGIISSLLVRPMFGGYAKGSVAFSGLRIIIFLLYGFITFGTLIMSIVVPILRFKSNLFGKEGYLTNVLPVSPSKHILSKTMSATIWQAITGIFVCFLVINSMFIIYGFPNPYYLFRGISDLFRLFLETDLSMYMKDIFQILTAIFLVILLAVVSVVASNLQFFASISIGHSVDKKKITASFGAYIGLYLISQIINLILINIFNKAVISNILLILVLLNVLYMGYAVLYFFITKYFLSKKLNLE